MMTKSTKKQARMSEGIKDGKPYECNYPWPEDCFCQGGSSGMVFTKGSFQEALESPDKAVDAITGKTPHYKTAFFEAFPNDPSTFIRGEGETIEAAEQSAWQQWQSIVGCTDHVYRTRGYENGGGFCIHCNLFSGRIFPSKPSTRAELEKLNTYGAHFTQEEINAAPVKVTYVDLTEKYGPMRREEIQLHWAEAVILD